MLQATLDVLLEEQLAGNTLRLGKICPAADYPQIELREASFLKLPA